MIVQGEEFTTYVLIMAANNEQVSQRNRQSTTQETANQRTCETAIRVFIENLEGSAPDNAKILFVSIRVCSVKESGTRDLDG